MKHPLLLVSLGCTLFFLGRLLSGKGLEDASRALGLSWAMAIAFGAVPDALPRKLRNWGQSAVAWLTERKASGIFSALLILLASTHALVGLGVHSWQGYDIAFFVQATHNAFSDSGPLFKNVEGNASFFAHHFSPFLYLLAPVGRLQEAPFALYLVQDLVLAVTGALLYREARAADLPPTAKALLLLLFWGHPFWRGLVYYEFHELSFAPIFSFLALRAWRRNQPWPLLAAAAGALCIKETLVFSVAWSGVLLAVFGRKPAMRAAGLAMALASVAVFIGYFKILLPSLAGRSESMFTGYYSHLGKSMGEVILSPFLRPRLFFGSVFSSDSLAYAASMFAVILPLLGRNALFLLPVIPDFALAILANGPNVKDPGNQYAGVVLVPVLFVALSGMEGWRAWSERRKALTAALIVALSFGSMKTNPIRIWKSFFSDPSQGAASREFVEALRAVPKDVPLVVADVTLLPFASQRESLVAVRPEAFDPAKVPTGAYLAWNLDGSRGALELCARTVATYSKYALCETRLASPLEPKRE